MIESFLDLRKDRPTGSRRRVNSEQGKSKYIDAKTHVKLQKTKDEEKNLESSYTEVICYLQGETSQMIAEFLL